MGTKSFYFLCLAALVFACKQQPKDTASYSSSEILQLAAPQIQVDSVLFNKSAQVWAGLRMEGVQIRYTTDGTEVSENSRLHERPLTITEPTEIGFRAFHPDYLPSEVVRTRLLKVKKNVSDAGIRVEPQPDANYSGSGPHVLVDLQKGTTQFRGSDQWLGFQGKRIAIDLEFTAGTTVSKVIISALNDHGSWIFLPKSIRVLADGKREIGQVSLPTPTGVEPKNLMLLDVPVATGTYKNLELQIDLLETIPSWHQGQGTAPFFFIDEILVE